MKNILFLIPFCILNTVLFAQWHAQTSGTSAALHSVYFTDSETGYAVGDGGTILKSINGGTNWIQQVSGTTEDLKSIYFTDTLTGYAVGWGGILKTTNGGNNWTKTSMIDEVFYSVYFPSKNIGYIFGSRGSNHYKTTDAGNSWIKQPFTGETYSSVYFTDTVTGYVAGPGILKTTDGGINWISQNTPPIFLSICFPAKDTGYAVGLYGTIVKTINGGDNWTTQVSGTTEYLMSVYFTNDTTGYAVGGNLINASPDIILKTSDGGVSWKPQSTPRSWFLYSVFFPAADTGYAVGYNGVILKTTNGGGDTIITQPEAIEEHVISKVIRLYPNPATNKLMIDFGKVAFGEIQIALYDIMGKQVTWEVTSKSQKMEIDISNLIEGIYFVKIYSKNSLVNVLKFTKEN